MHRLREPALVEFCLTLYNGVVAHRDDIDKKLASAAENWRVARMPAVDRNILRMAIFEMLHAPDVAPVVIINEAIEIAKKFGGDKSGGFVNGVLDRIKQELGRPAREAASPSN